MNDTHFFRRVLGTTYLAIIFGISIITWTSADFAEVAHLAPPPSGEGFSFNWNPLINLGHGCDLEQSSRFQLKKFCSYSETEGQGRPMTPAQTH